ncbi:MAG: hypothetical protein Kow0031_27150 [Anaerolineae bacterium]
MVQVLWLIGLPLGAATLVYVLRRFWAGAIIAALVALLLAWLAVNIPTGVVLNLLGRTVELDTLSQATLFFVFGATAALFLNLIFVTHATRQQRHGTSQRATGQIGRVFYPAALVILGLFVAASVTRHPGITAMIIELAAIIMVFIIQSERLESTRAALRFLILVSLATPLFLLAAWTVDNVQLTDRVISAETIEWVALLVGVGFAIWLAVVPFHSWLTSTAAESSPPTAAFVLIVFPTVAITAFLHLLADWPWLTDSLFLTRAIVLAGVVTAFTGGVLAFIQRGFSELLGHAALFDLGCIIAVLGVGGPTAVLTVLVYLAVRMLALVLLAVAMSTINLRATSTGFSQIQGIAYRMPLATFALMVGGFTLAGLPFTAGFAPHWHLFNLMADLDLRGVILLVLGGFGVAGGYLRGLRAALSTGGGSAKKEPRSLTNFEEPAPLLFLLIVLCTIVILFGLFPALLIEPLDRFAIALSFPGR